MNVRIGGLARVQLIAGKRAPVMFEGSDPAYVMTLVDTPDAGATRVPGAMAATSVASKMNAPAEVA